MPITRSYSSISVRQGQTRKAKKEASAAAKAKPAGGNKPIYDVKGPARKSPFAKC